MYAVLEPATDSPSVWLNTAAAAERTGLPKSTLRNWAGSGNSPVRCRKIGGRWAWLGADLDNLLAVNRP